MIKIKFEGGCLCGAIRYVGTAEPVVVTHCHCSECRRASGASFVTWVEFPPGAFEITTGDPRIHESTSDAGLRVHRHFCGDCGSLLTYRRPDTQQGIDVTAATLDAPDSVVPTDEVWTDSKLPWIEIGAVSKTYRRGRPRRSD